MKKILALITFMLLLTYSCSDQIISITGESEEVQKLDKDALSLDSSNIEILKPVCGTKDVTLWLFDHYELKTGKLIGIWPGPYTGEFWSDYRAIWGFSGIIVGTSSAYQTAINSGYINSNIMVQLTNYSNYQSLINSIDAQYYIDEPLEDDSFTSNQLLEILNYILSHRPGRKLNLGSFSTLPFITIPYFNLIITTTNSYIMCDYYDDGWLDFDQRDEWSYFKAVYRTKNSSNWIHSERDGISEFDQLFGHANNIGINALWLFIGSDGDAGNIDDFSYYAWKNGWLRRFERKYVYEYRCSYPDPCDCDPTLSEGWYLYKVWRFNDLREVFYQN